MEKDINILAIETSCDETAAAVVKNGRDVLSNVISSQIELHTLYGGVVPEIASRKHIENINYVIEKALLDAKMSLEEVDALAVTYGPGLVGALLVGVAEAKAISYALKKPLIPVHHIEGHVCANYIENKDLKCPFICLIVSGGHTNLVAVKDYTSFQIIGKTRDDAAGEAFDKVNDSKYDFSFSGIKSAVLNYQNHAKMLGESIVIEDVAASFQRAVVEVLTEHTIMAAKEYGIIDIALAGGVASNFELRRCMENACKKEGMKLFYPSPIYCTDNAAMIGSAGYYRYISGVRADLDLNAVPGLKFAVDLDNE